MFKGVRELLYKVVEVGQKTSFQQIGPIWIVPTKVAKNARL